MIEEELKKTLTSIDRLLNERLGFLAYNEQALLYIAKVNALVALKDYES